MSTTTISKGVERATGWSVGGFLGAATLLTVPLGTQVGLLPSEIRSPLPVTVVIAVLSILDLALGFILARAFPRQASPVMAVVLVAGLAVPLAVHGHGGSQLLAFGLFALGTLGGAAVGVTWARSWTSFGLVDLGLVGFVLVSVGQLSLIALANPSLAGFHQAAVLPWGGSNYVAGVLVVSGYVLIARGSITGRRLQPVAVLGMAAAVATLSRGALVALSAGLVVYLWGRGSTRLSRFSLRATTLVAPFVAWEGMEAVTASRSTGGFDPGTNIDARWALFRYAWDSFVTSPVSGTGWLAMRDNPEFIVPISYAHNSVLSFLQIGGFFGIVALLALFVAMRRVWRIEPRLRSALVAALAISMTDPFFEGLVAALVVWAVLTAVQRAQCADTPGAVETALPNGRRLTGAVRPRGVGARPGPATARRRTPTGTPPSLPRRRPIPGP